MRRGEPGALLQPGTPGRAVGTVRLLVKGCGPVYGSDHADLGRTTHNAEPFRLGRHRRPLGGRSSGRNGVTATSRRRAFWVGRHTPTTSTPDTTTPGAPSDVQICLRWAGSGTSSSRSRPCRYGSDGGSSRTTSPAPGGPQGVDVGLGDQPRAALDGDGHRGGPVRVRWPRGWCRGTRRCRRPSRAGRTAGRRPAAGWSMRRRRRAGPASCGIGSNVSGRDPGTSRAPPGSAARRRSCSPTWCTPHGLQNGESCSGIGVGDRPAELGLRHAVGQHRPRPRRRRCGYAQRAAPSTSARRLRCQPSRAAASASSRGQQAAASIGQTRRCGAGEGRRAGSRPA